MLIIMFYSESLGVWDLSIVRYSKQLTPPTFRELDMFPSSGEGRKTPTLLGPLERANLNRLYGTQQSRCLPPLIWLRKQSQFRKIAFYSYWEYRTMDKVYESGDSECHTPSSEPFKIHRLLSAYRTPRAAFYCVYFKCSAMSHVSHVAVQRLACSSFRCWYHT
jgi:hypothetical protein